MKQQLFLLTFILFNIYLPAQNQQNTDSLKHPEYYQIVDIEDFNIKLFQQILEDEINGIRSKQGMDSLKQNVILQNAAEDQANFMAAKQQATLYQSGKKKTTGKRIQYYGGSTFGDEVVTKMSPRKGKITLTYKELADNIVFKLLKSKKTMRVIMDPKYILQVLVLVLTNQKRKFLFQ